MNYKLLPVVLFFRFPFFATGQQQEAPPVTTEKISETSINWWWTRR